VFSSSNVESPLDEFFTCFWAAIDARTLTSLDRIPASTAFLSSLLECMTFLLRRLSNSPLETSQSVLLAAALRDSHAAVDDLLCQFIHRQFSRICEELASKHLMPDYAHAGRFISENLLSLGQIDEGHYLFKVLCYLCAKFLQVCSRRLGMLSTLAYMMLSDLEIRMLQMLSSWFSSLCTNSPRVAYKKPLSHLPFVKL
jgi:hypothetical protein